MPRQSFPDELRGIALLGIVLVNAPFLVISQSGSIGGDASLWWDLAADWGVAAFAQGKSYLLFAALFGYGAALMLRLDHGAVDPSAVRRYRRRLLGLGLVGALHAVLLFIGDILLPYALIGLLVPWLAMRSDRWLLRLAAGAWAVAVAVLALLVLAVAAEPGSAEISADSSYDQAMADGSVWATILARVDAYPDAAITLAVLNWPLILACFCVGLVAGRRSLFADLRSWTASSGAEAVSRVALIVGVPAGILAGLLQVGVLGGGGTGEIGGVALAFATAPLLSAGYVVWLARASVAGRLAWAARAGRQSLTGYVGESLLLAAIACPWGLGLYGELGSAAVLGIAVGVFIAYEIFAAQWTRHCRQGPLEWLLRWWTYAARPQLRRARPTPVS